MAREAPTHDPGGPEIEESHQDVSSGTVRLRATEWRTRSARATPLLILPGALSSRLSFRALAQHLASDFQVIAIDFPGFGDSEKPPPSRYPYGISAFADATADLFAGMNLARAHVLGHGLGGAVALRLAARHPELVIRLALMAPLIETAPSARFLLGPVLGGLFLRQFVGKRLFFRMYREYINPDVEASALTQWYEALTPPACRSALLSTLRAAQEPREVIADSRRVRAPTLLLWGRDDRLLPVEHGRRLSREMPEAGLELLSSGHAPHEQHPETTAATLGSFFSGRRAGSR